MSKYIASLPAKLPESLSPSQLQTYQSCHYKWYLQYAVGLKPIGPDYVHFAKGSYIHELLHYYYGLVESGYTPGDPTLISAIQSRINEDFTQAENPDAEFFDHCARTAVGYVQHRSPVIDLGLSKLQIEQHLEVNISGRVLHGFADLIYVDPNGRHVIRDHKTGNRDTFDQDGVSRNSQLLFYGMLYYKMTGIVADVEINYVNSNPPKKAVKTPLWNTYRVKHTEREYAAFFQWVEAQALRQESDLFHFHYDHWQNLRNWFACGRCPYHLICESDLKGLSSDVTVRSRYELKEPLQPKDTQVDVESVQSDS